MIISGEYEYAYCRGVVMCSTCDELARAIADTLNGTRHIQDVCHIDGIGLVYRTGAPQYIEFSILQAPCDAGTRVWLNLCNRASRHIIAAQRYGYPANVDAEQIAEDAADRFWTWARLPVT